MNISVEQVHAGIPVTVMRLEGELDASNYQELIRRADSLYQDGMRHVLLDLSDLSFLSSSGLVALHSVALTMRGERPVDPEGGWNVFHSMSHDLESQSRPQENCKLLNPQARVLKTLDVSGFSRLLPIYTDMETALASFPGV